MQRTRTDDNHIGNEWSYSYKLNGEIIHSGEYELSVGDEIELYAVFTEIDENPDVGEAAVTHTVTRDDLLNGFTLSTELTVKENGGRNSGQQAQFTITYTFSNK